MANWKHVINLTDILYKYEDDEIADHFDELKNEMVKLLEAHLEEIKQKFDTEFVEEFENIIFQFKDASDINEYDYILEDLYDLGDANNSLWLNTFK